MSIIKRKPVKCILCRWWTPKVVIGDCHHPDKGEPTEIRSDARITCDGFMKKVSESSIVKRRK